ncbi:uncharacterized protein LOC122248640 [Penaeus japonicus]|uniref:uncharacterized protein LOC122248640 n=1 Tax=Penaeus japonicus TaxID=27405 RepID=UPI001C715B82|nr:uncharacterized protein LOC122248640 [Penaeus japonicus]
MFLQGMRAALVAAVVACAAAGPALRQATCGGQVSLENGATTYFTSPNFPFPYPNGISCLYIAQSPPNTVIRMTCDAFNVAPSQECRTDVLFVSPSGNRYMGDASYYCGSGTVEVTTNGNAFAAYFFSRPKTYYNFYQGFRCSLTVLPKNQGLEQTTTLKPQPTTTTIPKTNPPSDCECGRRSGSRIVGGEEATPNEWPWQAALRFMSNGEVFCGATLVQNSWLVTASHCVEQFDKSDIFVSLGDHVYNQQMDTQYEQHISIKEIIMHEKYDSLTVDNDIALIQLSGPVQYNAGISPVCLPFQFASKDFQGENVTVTGWGTNVFQGEVNQALHEVELPVISDSKCKEYLGGSITSNMMCTYNPGRDACQGDSGGPLVWASEGRYYLVGVVSWGRDCAAEELPGVYAKVTNYLGWIEGKINDGVSVCGVAGISTHNSLNAGRKAIQVCPVDTRLTPSLALARRIPEMKTLWFLIAVAAAEGFPGTRQSPGCSGSVSLGVGESIQLTSPKGYGTSSISCIWEATSPANTVMTLSCPDFNVLHDGQNCVDAFYFSSSGSYNDYRYYCGVGTLTLSTSSNIFKAAFYASEKTYAVYSQFNCILKVIAKECECGVKGAARIVGGQNANINEWPWQAALRRKENFREVFCGATLIHREWLVTSAHCAAEYPREDLYVTLGDHLKDQVGETPFERNFEIAELIIHENYDANKVDNDIALIRLSSPASYSQGVARICLPFQFASQDFQGETGTVTGWGTTQFQGSVSNVLQEVSLPILTTAECQVYLKGSVTDNMLCTYKPGQDACRGDSGGPLSWTRDGRYYLVGVVSWGMGCASAERPGVYTKVTNYLPWIQQKTGAQYC